jgi:hypothetical protein
MADPFGIGGIIGLTIQITQFVVQFGLDWKDAPRDVKTFLIELQALKTVLSETNTNLLLNPDFEAATSKADLHCSSRSWGLMSPRRPTLRSCSQRVKRS